MNLAEQIKNELRQSNPIDYEKLTKIVKDIFVENPRNRISIYPRDVNEIKWDKGSISNYYYINIPNEWAIDVEEWADKEGFNIERGNIKFSLTLF